MNIFRNVVDCSVLFILLELCEDASLNNLTSGGNCCE